MEGGPAEALAMLMTIMGAMSQAQQPRRLQPSIRSVPSTPVMTIDLTSSPTYNPTPSPASSSSNPRDEVNRLLVGNGNRGSVSAGVGGGDTSASPSFNSIVKDGKRKFRSNVVSQGSAQKKTKE